MYTSPVRSGRQLSLHSRLHSAQETTGTIRLEPTLALISNTDKCLVDPDALDLCSKCR
jgi:hypothetical protein